MENTPVSEARRSPEGSTPRTDHWDARPLLLTLVVVCVATVVVDDVTAAVHAAPSAVLIARGAVLAFAFACYRMIARRGQAVDMVRRNAAEELERANAALSLEIERRKVSEEQKDRMFSIIAHDLRAPFSVLLGFASILREEAAELPPEQIERYSGSIHANGVRLLALLDNMLQWARLQMKRVKLVPSTEPLHPIVERLFMDVAETAGAKNVKLENRVADITVEADATLLATILRNLVTNAVKFTQAGGTVTVRAAAEDDVVAIEVSDSGVGIPEDRMARLFEPGAQRATPGTKGETGTGLGLLICRDLIELHGGRLEVASTLGKGTTFRFRLPRGEVHGVAAPSAAGSEHELGERA
jgi:signal transduction histidine kinase